MRFHYETELVSLLEWRQFKELRERLPMEYGLLDYIHTNSARFMPGNVVLKDDINFKQHNEIVIKDDALVCRRVLREEMDSAGYFKHFRRLLREGKEPKEQWQTNRRIFKKYFEDDEYMIYLQKFTDSGYMLKVRHISPERNEYQMFNLRRITLELGAEPITPSELEQKTIKYRIKYG